MRNNNRCPRAEITWSSGRCGHPTRHAADGRCCHAAEEHATPLVAGAAAAAGAIVRQSIYSIVWPMRFEQPQIGGS